MLVTLFKVGSTNNYFTHTHTQMLATLFKVGSTYNYFTHTHNCLLLLSDSGPVFKGSTIRFSVDLTDTPVLVARGDAVPPIEWDRR
jgi:hypothetical protein